MVPTFFPHQSLQEGTESEVLHLEETDKANNTGGHGWTALCRGPLCVEDHWTEHPLSSPWSPHFSMLCFGKMIDSVTKTTKIARELVNAYVSS